VDLSTPTIQLLSELPDTGELIFSTTGRTPPSGFSKAKQRLDKLINKGLDAPLPHWQFHDLRRTAASGMAALGHPPHIVDRVINHLSGSQGGLTAVYQRHEYRPERKRAIREWGEYVATLVESQYHSG